MLEKQNWQLSGKHSNRRQNRVDKDKPVLASVQL